MRNGSKNFPDIVIVKKIFPKYRKKQRKRNWKLKHLEKKEGGPEDEEDEIPQEELKGKAKKKQRGGAVELRN